MKRAVYETMGCKVCGSNNTVRVGQIKGVQRWECRDCGRKFLDNGARFGMKTPSIQVSMALRWYYQGMSLNNIRQELLKKFNNCPSDSTIYYWVSRSTEVAMNKLKDDYPVVGTTWIADETVVKHYERPVLIWDILDMKTWFLIATQVIFKRSPEKAQLLLTQAINKAGKVPKEIRTDKLATYYSDIKLHSTNITKYSKEKVLRIEDKSTDELKNFHDVLQWRKKHMSNLRSMDSLVKYNTGWLIYYNYYRPHKSLMGKTPGEAAKTSYCVINFNG